MPGVPCPLAGRKPGDIDFVVVRENTEGEYSSVGGITFPGTEREIVVQETIMTRHGTDRILRYAFDLAQRRPARHLTSATRSEEHTSELQSLMRISYAVFCLKKKKPKKTESSAIRLQYTQ